MALDYKSSYKQRKIKKNITIAAIILGILILSSLGYVVVKKQLGEGTQGMASKDDQTTEKGINEQKTTKNTADYGKALQRPQIYLYTIGVPHASLSTEREYQLVEERVTDHYFEDAVFIGDSRTEGFVLYSSLRDINAYCSKGLSISRIYTDEIVAIGDGRVVTTMDALQEKKFKKVYVMFGINELGWPYDDLFREQYTKLIRDIKQLQPDAIIYIQNILPVSEERSANDNIYNNTNVSRFNDMIKGICEEQQVIYLDVASSMMNENGALPADASTDGIHCNRKYCDIWLEYLRNNTYELSQ